MYVISGRVAIITGGCKGIGKAICIALLEKGASICIADLDTDEGIKLQKHFEEKHGPKRCIFIPCDVTKKDELNNAFVVAQNEFGHVDIVCNNAGIVDEDHWEDMVELNLSSVIRGTYLARKFFKAREKLDERNKRSTKGVVVNVASNAALNPSPGIHVYSATKAGVVGFTRSLQYLYQHEGLRVNCVCPVSVDTPLWRRTFAWLPEDMKKKELELGYVSAEIVADGVIKLIQEEDNAGKALQITFDSIRYV